MLNFKSLQKLTIGYYLYLLFSLAIGIWVIYRSVHLSFTNDEAFSYFNVATGNIKMMCGTANTHWLNSLFIFAETILLGNKEWMLRVHSCLSYFVFVWFVYKIFKPYISSTWQLLIPLVFFHLNIYLLDFFSIARGYGMSIGFEIIAFYLILHLPKTNKYRFYIYLFLALATFSCYTAIFILVAYFIHDLISQISDLGLKNLFSFRFCIPSLPFWGCLIFAIPNILFIRHTGDLEEGQSNGFILDSMGVFFERSYPFFENTAGLQFFCYFLLHFLASYYFFRMKSIPSKMKSLIELYFINIILIEFLYFAFEIPYVFGRTSLYLNILLLLLAIYILMDLLHKLPKYYGIGFCVLLLIGALSNFILNKNHHTTIEWYKSQEIEICISDLEKIEGNRMVGKKLGMHLAQLGSYTNYYKVLHKSSLNDTIYSFCENRSGMYDSSTLKDLLKLDYLIMLKPYDHYFYREDYELIKHYKNMNADLIRIKKKTDNELH